MGKVQEVLAKIRTNATTSSTIADNLCIPESQEQQDSTLPTDAAGVKNWLIAQDAANSAGSRSDHLAYAKSLLRILTHCNRTICTPADRLETMNVYEKPFTQVMQRLDSRYLYLDFPLLDDAEKTFQLAMMLCLEMAYGYKIAVVNTFENPSTENRFAIRNKKPHRTRRLRAIKSAFRHLGNVALRHSQINRDWPDPLWQDLNALHHIATNDRTADDAESSTIDSAHATTDQPTGNQLTVNEPTVNERYASLCGLYILDQKKLKAEEVRCLFVELTRHANLVSFHSTAALAEQDTTEQQQPIIYSVGADIAPAIDEFRLNPPDNKTRGKLVHFSLDTLLEKLASDSTGSLFRTCSRAKRTQSRAQRSTLITAETGLQDIHTRISLTPPEEDTESQFTDLSCLLSVHESDSNQKQTGHTQLLNQDSASASSISFQVENESPHGFGLKWTGEGSCNVQVGELMAHCYKTNRDNKRPETSWHLSIVRWLRTDADGTLRLGVESISHHTKAVDVVRSNKSQQNSQSTVAGLLINYQPIDSKARMLILPRQNYKTGENIVYRDDQNVHLAKLMESVEIPGGYQCFATKDLEEELTLRQTTDTDHYQVAV